MIKGLRKNNLPR